MPVSPARAAAFDILLRVEMTDAYASELLHSSRVAKLSPADHGLATEIVMGVLRWRSVLDEQIAVHVNQRPPAAKAANNSAAPLARLEAGPSRKDPSRKDPSWKDPSRKDPSRKGPSRKDPSRKDPPRKGPLSKLDVEVMTALRIGAYQLLFLDRIPAHAAINESVELAKQARKRSAAGMVNAVLRRVSQQASAKDAANRGSEVQLREGIAAAMPKERLDAAPLGAEAAAEAAIKPEEHSARLEAVPSRSESSGEARNDKTPNNPRHSPLSSRAERDLSLAKDHTQSRACGERPSEESESNGDLHSSTYDNAVRAHPAWLVERWERTYGDAAARAICGYNQTTPDTVIRADKNLVEELASEAVRLDPGRLLKDASVVVSGDITRTRAFREKRLVIQDEGSQLVALLLGEGRLILDCCAAPGGKTRIIAQEKPHAIVIATELHAHRAMLMKRLVPLSNVHVAAADIRTMPFAAPFDRILVDAPCTGTGTLARNPEIKWRLTPDDISRMQPYQIEILSAAIEQLAPGGQVLYSTCSLEPEENEAVIEQVLRAKASLRLLNIQDRLTELHNEGALICAPDWLTRGSYLRTIPGVHPCDGFFAALLERQM